PDTHASWPHDPGLAWGQPRDRTRRGACTSGPQPGRQNDLAQDPAGLVPSEWGPCVPTRSPDIAAEHPGPRRLYARESGVSPLLDCRRAARVLWPVVTGSGLGLESSRARAAREDGTDRPCPRTDRPFQQGDGPAPGTRAGPDRGARLARPRRADGGT